MHEWFYTFSNISVRKILPSCPLIIFHPAQKSFSVSDACLPLDWFSPSSISFCRHKSHRRITACYLVSCLSVLHTQMPSLVLRGKAMMTDYKAMVSFCKLTSLFLRLEHLSAWCSWKGLFSVSVDSTISSEEWRKFQDSLNFKHIS